VQLQELDGTLLGFGAGWEGTASAGATGLAAGDYLVRVSSGEDAPVAYALESLDAESCVPVAQVGDLRVRRAAGGRVRLEWAASRDLCHASYRVYEGGTPRPAVPPGAFPDDPALADVTGRDEDGEPADGSALLQAGPGTTFYLVVDVGTDGASGPAGHY
jgi:hypothetical protein